jgi:hypothetical protein
VVMAQTWLYACRQWKACARLGLVPLQSYRRDENRRSYLFILRRNDEWRTSSLAPKGTATPVFRCSVLSHRELQTVRRRHVQDALELGLPIYSKKEKSLPPIFEWASPGQIFPQTWRGDSPPPPRRAKEVHPVTPLQRDGPENLGVFVAAEGRSDSADELVSALPQDCNQRRFANVWSVYGLCSPGSSGRDRSWKGRGRLLLLRLGLVETTRLRDWNYVFSGSTSASRWPSWKWSRTRSSSWRDSTEWTGVPSRVRWT